MKNIDDMVLFAEVAETCSLTEAGHRLGLPKSTVSQRMTRLEERLGLKLLNRSTRAISLTHSGQVFLQYCRKIRSDANAASVAMSNLRSQPVGSLRITCPEITASYLMPDLMQGFRKLYPGIEIDLLATNKNLDLRRENIDFAFRVGEVVGQDLIVRNIAHIDQCVVASKSYLDVAGNPLHPEDIGKHKCLVHHANPVWRFALRGTQHNLSPAAGIQSDSMGFLLHSCIAGEGLAMLPAYVCSIFISSGALLPLFRKWKIPGNQMSFVFLHRQQQSKTQQAFRAYLNEYDLRAKVAFLNTPHTRE